MNKLRLRYDDFHRLDNAHRSGDMVDVNKNVYHILDYHFLSNHLIGYSPTMTGYTLWLYDVIADWLSTRKCLLICWLSRHNFAYVPEGCYPAWSDIGKRPPAKELQSVNPMAWGELLRALNLRYWGGD